MVALYLLIPSVFVLILGVVLHRGTPFNRVWIVLLVTTLPIASVNVVGDVEVNFALSDVLLLLLLFVALAVGAVKKTPLRLPALGLTTALLAWVLLSLMVGVSRYGTGSSLVYVIALAKFIALFLYLYAVVNLIDSSEDVRLFLQTWLITSSLVAMLGIAGSLLFILTGQRTPLSEGIRALGTFENPNLFAAYVSLSFFFACALLVRAESPGARAFLLLPMVLQLVALGLSASRGGALGFVFGLLVLLILSRSFHLRVASGALVLTPLIVLFTLSLLAPALRNSVQPILNRIASAQDLESQAHVRRYFLWRQAIASFDANPVFGVGRGNYRGIVAKDREMRYAKTPHNTFLGILAETGLLGLVLFLAILGSFLPSLLRWVRKSTEPISRSAAAAFLSALIAIVIHGLASDLGNFRGLWTLLALIHRVDLTGPPLCAAQPPVSHS
jgi:O-antigen ligase